MQQTMAKAPLFDLKPTTPVFDLKFNSDSLYDPSGQPVRVGNPHALSQAVFVPGGLLGQLALTLAAVAELIQTKENYSEFKFSQ